MIAKWAYNILYLIFSGNSDSKESTAMQKSGTVTNLKKSQKREMTFTINMLPEIHG